nr:copper resistance CopC family protein [Sphaerisporangium rubeum]
MGLSVFVLGAPAAYAHGRLVVSTPAEGSKLDEPVESLSLAFTEKPASFAYFTVTAPNGQRVDQRWWHSEPFPLDEPVRELNLVNGVWEPQFYHTGFPVTVPVSHWPGKGTYVARYKTVASDGEKVEGELRFTYTGRVTAAPPGWQPPADEPLPELLAAIEQGPSSAAPQATSQQAQPQQAPSQQPQTQQPQRSPVSQDGDGVSVWLVPVLLVAGAGVLIAWPALRRPRAASRVPGPRGRRPGPTSRSPGSKGRRPASASAARKRRQ